MRRTPFNFIPVKSYKRDSLLRESSPLLENPRPGFFQKWKRSVMKVSENYAMCAIVGHNKLIYIGLSYSMVL